MRGDSAWKLVAAASAALVPGAGLGAADLFVAGTIGEVYKGDSRSGAFEYFGGICLAPVRALAFDAASVYAGDLNGGIMQLDLTTGDFVDLFWVPGSNASDIVVHQAHLLVSSTSGTIHRVDPVTQTVLSTRTSPIQLQAMALRGDDLYVAGTIGEVYKGNALTGGFQPFAGICLGPIQALALSDTTIYAGDLVGAVARFDLATGDFLGATFVPDSVTALAWDGDGVLVSEIGGTIFRLDPQNGAILNTMTAPIFVDAMDLRTTTGDIDGDGHVDVTDFLALLSAWGPCPGAPCPADLDGDGSVGIVDFLLLLANWS